MTPARRTLLAGAALLALRARAQTARHISVGPGREITTLAAAARIARDGDVVEVDAGSYRGDVAVWTQHQLTLRAFGGRAALHADGAAAEGKAIWVIRAQGMRVEGFDFSGCRVPHRNGAGIRFEGGSLSVRDCGFFDNEMGLLTANDPAMVLEVAGCEFARNHRPDGHNHNLYAGSIARLVVTGSWLHSARIGHLLKSRAASNLIAANLLADGADGSASYELEFPNGGRARVLGNLIQQSRATQNPHLVSFGAEGWRWPANELLLAHNTLIDDSSGGILLRISPGAGPGRFVLANNLWLGSSRIDATRAELHNNFSVSAADFEPGPVHHRRLRAASPAWGRALDAGPDLRQTLAYLHPRQAVALAFAARHPGALQ